MSNEAQDFSFRVLQSKNTSFILPHNLKILAGAIYFCKFEPTIFLTIKCKFDAKNQPVILGNELFL